MESEESFQTNVNTLKEMILDEEKIVTYVSLSKDLCIHLNNSKKLLHYIAQNLPDIKLNVNYLISGITDNNKARTTVCTEDDLKNIEKSFKTILFKHVYSVSRGNPNTDHAAYLLLSKFDDFSLCAGLIKNSECNKHTSAEIGSLKSNSQQAVSVDTKELVVSQKSVKSESKKVTNLVKNTQLDSKPIVENGEKLKTNVKTEVVSPVKEASNNKQSNNKINNNHKTQKGIAGFFNKSNINSKNNLKQPVSQTNTKVKEDIKIKEEKMEIDIESNGIDSKKEEKDIKEEPNLIKKNKVLNKIKKSSKVDKKRKRVLLVSDSDSDEQNDPFADKLEKQEIKNESDDEIPPTPSIDSIKITSGIVNPKKRRKVVDKTYTDEDGYILTKKEEVYESCSENEEDVKVKEEVKQVLDKVEISPKSKKNNSVSTKKKISPPQKGKQTTLAHFFSKK